MNRKAAFALGLLISVTLTALAGGFPSRPNFQAVGVNTTAPSAAGSIAATTATFSSSANQGGVRLTSVSPALVWTESDGAADNQNWRIRVNTEGLTWNAVNDAFNSEVAFLTVQRTGITVDSVDINAATVNINSEQAATTISGTFTASFDTGCTTTPTVTFDYVRSGTTVTVIETAQTGFSCTGDATTMATTGAPIPLAIRPNAATFAKFLTPDSVIDNATNVAGCITFAQSGNVVIYKRNATGGCDVSTWTAAGARNTSIIGATYTWHTVNP